MLIRPKTISGYIGLNNNNTHNIYMGVLYTKGLSESFKIVSNKVGVKLILRGKILSGTFW